MRERKSNRLKDHDYAQDGYYFVTVCVQDKKHLFGDIVDGVMVVNEAGRVVSNVIGTPHGANSREPIEAFKKLYKGNTKIFD